MLSFKKYSQMRTCTVCSNNRETVENKIQSRGGKGNGTENIN